MILYIFFSFREFQVLTLWSPRQPPPPLQNYSVHGRMGVGRTCEYIYVCIRFVCVVDLMCKFFCTHTFKHIFSLCRWDGQYDQVDGRSVEQIDRHSMGEQTW